MKSKRAKACNIPQKVKKAVWERDKQSCIFCGNPQAMPNGHYIRRSNGGLGIEQNVVTLCAKCHHEYDNGSGREVIGAFIKGYLKSQYEDWDEDKLIYRKWG